jgi:stearoyl-CoA desaturase (delta-9 desaturase)
VGTKQITIDQRAGLNWSAAVTLTALHIAAIVALFHFEWRYLAIAAVLHWVATGLGISMGYHRLHTHRSYRVPKALEYFFALCGTLTLQGGPIYWAATHRLHHQKSDQPGDPHSPVDGAWWSHIGWIVFSERNTEENKMVSRYARDLSKDRFYVWLNDYHWVPLAGLAVLMLVLGGMPLVLWAIAVRIVFGLHSTWLVNSATHMWGGRRFATRDDSRNTWWVALLTFGEGWHNNHHAYPTSARHGLAWYEFDPSWIQIRILKFFGLAKAIQVVSVNTRYSEREAA